MKIYDVSEDHIRDTASNMRDGDRKECLDILGLSPYNAVKQSVLQSEEAYTGWRDGILGIIGVVPPSLLGDTAQPWMLTTNQLTKSPRVILKFTKPFIKRWLERYPRLVNYVDAEYTAALRWAKWSGFTIHEPAPYGANNILCCKIEIRRD